MSNLARQDTREATAITDKPVVAICKANILDWGTTAKVLTGYPVNHPNQRLNDKLIRTSNIQKIDGNVVETRNTIYNVMSWGETEKDPRQLELL